MNIRRSLFRLIGLLVIAAVVSGTPVLADVTKKRATLAITQGPATARLVVEVDDTPLFRGQGLRFRKFLPETSGMLLVYDRTLFWPIEGMGDILFPLSIALIDYDSDNQQWEIVEIVDEDVAPDPHHGPFRNYEATKPFRYMLEVNQGFFQRHHIGVGATVQDTTGALFGAPAPEVGTGKRTTLTITQGPTTATLAVEIADTRDSRARGLSLRKSLPETAGMLFVYETTAFWNFGWMVDMFFPLSVALIDYDSDTQQWQIVEIVDMDVDANPHYGPNREYKASKPFRYALEVNQGFFQRHHLSVGAKVQDTTGALFGVPALDVGTGKRGTLTIAQGPTMVTLTVEVADTPDTIARGLRLRKSLPGTGGMLYVFNNTAFHSLWDQEILIPLSVAFIADLSEQLYLHRPELVIVDIRDMNVTVNPGYGPWRAYESAQPCRYGLEVNQGFFQQHNITVGAKVTYRPP